MGVFFLCVYNMKVDAPRVMLIFTLQEHHYKIHVSKKVQNVGKDGKVIKTETVPRFKILKFR